MTSDRQQPFDEQAFVDAVRAEHAAAIAADRARTARYRVDDLAAALGGDEAAAERLHSSLHYEAERLRIVAKLKALKAERRARAAGWQVSDSR